MAFNSDIGRAAVLLALGHIGQNIFALQIGWRPFRREKPRWPRKYMFLLCLRFSECM